MGDHDDHPADDEPARRAWARAGVPRDEIDVWQRWRFDPSAAGAWRRAGVADGLSAAQWETAGVSPATVADWMAEGITATEAVRWHEFGFDLAEAKARRGRGETPDQALRNPLDVAGGSGFRKIGTNRVPYAGIGFRGGPQNHPMQRFLEAGVDHRLLHDYLQHQWVDDAALAWARQGISATDAYQWHDLGLTAIEAGRLVADGQRFGEVMRDWWRSGIPFDEVADWIGAGLSVAEAVDQRAAGVTVDQAAALRALRQQEDTPARRPGPAVLWQRLGPPGSEQSGPPPADQEAARAEITQVITDMFDTLDDHGGLALVDGGSNLGPSAETARNRISGGQPGPVTNITVTGIRFINGNQAQVAFNLDVHGATNAHLHDRLGRAVLVDGHWKASRDTVMELLGMAGVSCPPPPSEG